ncbi:MAG: cadherin domain-containing protein, partial [Bacteroidales bacterium]|nr:cadherin domain-containing protein [Bacteroidales bacterium]
NIYNSTLSIVNWEASNFHRTSNLNDGLDVGMQYDFDSVFVSNPPEIGSYEYNEGGQSNNPPTINNQAFSIEENTTNGGQVGNIIATDPDQGQTLTYSIQSGNTDNAFQVNSNTGELTVNNSEALDYETNPEFNLMVQVQDNGPGNLTSQATITANIMDINEAPEIYDQSFIINEDSQNGQALGIMYAVDPDFGQTLTYSILSGNPDNVFYLDPYSGIIFVANSSALNYTSNPQFNLVVEVQDNGQGNLTDLATITVLLTIVNEPPNLIGQDFIVNENSPYGYAVGIMYATDPDYGQTLTYSILSGNNNNAFYLDPNSGVLLVLNSSEINYEINTEFNLIVQVQDNGPGNLIDQEMITVTIADINEPPNIYNQEFILNENSPNGAMVGLMYAVDPDIGQSLSYSIILGNEDDAFFLDPNSGVLFVENSAALNYNTNPVYDLLVQVQDNGPGSLIDMAIINILLTSENGQDNILNPNINNLTFGIEENSVDGAQVGLVIATPLDQGQTLTYSIISGNTNNAFEINAYTGELTVNNSEVIDYETNSVYNLLVQVQDNGIGSLVDQIIVTVSLINLVEPIANFTANTTTVTAGDRIFFQDESLNFPTNLIWQFDGGAPITSFDKNPIITYYTPGLYNVGFIASNADGHDMLIKTAYIEVLANNNLPISNFTANTNIVIAGESIFFQNESLNLPTNWMWQFEGGSPFTSLEENPIVAYNTPGKYNVKLVSFNSNGNDILIKTDYIEVQTNNNPPIANFTANKTIVHAGESISYQDESLNIPTDLIWQFEGGTPSTSFDANPIITYNSPGLFHVELVASNSNGNDVLLKTGYIEVFLEKKGEEVLNSYVNTNDDIKYKMNLYPNPTDNFINLNLPNIDNEKYTIKIYSLFGEMAKEIEFNAIPGNLIEKIDVSELKFGTYIIQLSGGQINERKKFFKL